MLMRILLILGIAWVLTALLKQNIAPLFIGGDNRVSKSDVLYCVIAAVAIALAVIMIFAPQLLNGVMLT